MMCLRSCSFISMVPRRIVACASELRSRCRLGQVRLGQSRQFCSVVASSCSAASARPASPRPRSTLVVSSAARHRRRWSSRRIECILGSDFDRLDRRCVLGDDLDRFARRRVLGGNLDCFEEPAALSSSTTSAASMESEDATGSSAITGVGSRHSFFDDFGPVEPEAARFFGDLWRLVASDVFSSTTTGAGTTCSSTTCSGTMCSSTSCSSTTCSSIDVLVASMTTSTLQPAATASFARPASAAASLGSADSIGSQVDDRYERSRPIRRDRRCLR